MAGIGGSTELLFKIRGDSSDGVAAVEKFKKELKELEKAEKDQLGPLQTLAAQTGTSAERFNTLKSQATLAIGAITAVAGAAAATGIGLFKLAEAAATAGSAIFDASEKTGLSAETLSSLKYAAEQSGSSLEAFTTAAARFAKTVGEAADGSKEAAADLKKFGIDPQEAIADLDGALSKVFKTIVEARPGIEQITLAQNAFGRSGSDLLPTIKSFDGDMGKLIKTAKELGLTLTNEDAKAADKFGDQLDDLHKQLAAVGRVIGQELIPVFGQMANDISTFLKNNPGVVESWGKSFAYWIQRSADVVLNFKTTLEGLSDELDDLGKGNIFSRSPELLQRRKQRETTVQGIKNRVAGTDIQGSLQESGETVLFPGTGLGTDGKTFRPTPGVPDSVPRGTQGPQKPNVIKVKRADSQAEFDKAAKANAERLEKERIARIRENLAIEIAEKRAAIGTLIALEKQRYAEGKITEEEAIRFRREHEVELTSLVINAKQRELDAIKGNAAEEKRIKSEIKILNAELEKQYAEYAENDAERIAAKKKAEEELHADRRKRWDETLEQLEKEILAEGEKADAKLRQDAADEHAATLRGQLGEELGVNIPLYDPAIVDQVTANAELMKAVFADLSQGVVGSLAAMAQGMAQMLVQWIITGKFSAQAALQMAAGVAMGLAIQAGMKALFNVAEGIAAAANPFTAWMAPGYFAAAKAYAVVAAVAGGAGVALGFAARAAGGGNKQTAGSAFAGQTSGSGTGAKRDTSGQGQAYSGLEPETRTVGINQPGGLQVNTHNTVTVKIEDDSSVLGRLLKIDVDQNGQATSIIRDLVNRG